MDFESCCAWVILMRGQNYTLKNSFRMKIYAYVIRLGARKRSWFIETIIWFEIKYETSSFRSFRVQSSNFHDENNLIQRIDGNLIYG